MDRVRGSGLVVVAFLDLAEAEIVDDEQVSARPLLESLSTRFARWRSRAIHPAVATIRALQIFDGKTIPTPLVT